MAAQQPSEEDVKKAMEYVESNMSKEDLQNLQNTTMALGINVIREALRAIARNNNKLTDEIEQNIKDISPIIETTGYDIDFLDVKTNKRKKILLSLQAVNQEYDFSKEIGKWKEKIAEDKHEQFLDQVGKLLTYARSLYSSFMIDRADLVERIMFATPRTPESRDEFASIYQLAVDTEKTLLYVPNVPGYYGVTISQI